MWITTLSYRLKGEKEVKRKSFEKPEDAQAFLVDEGLQVVVGQLDNVPNPTAIYEAAALKSRADWFEFSHEVIQY